MTKPDEKLQARGGDMNARVNPLVWAKDTYYSTDDDNGPLEGVRMALDAWVANGYLIIQQRNNGLYLLRGKADGIGLAETTLDAAKAAAQADYEARILAALELAPDLAELRDDWDELMAEARAEAAKAMRKFPQPNYVISKIAEEAGEVVKAAIHCAEGRETAENLRGEMKQTLAMLYRLWVEGDQVHGLPPVAAALAKIKEPQHG